MRQKPGETQPFRMRLRRNSRSPRKEICQECLFRKRMSWAVGPNPVTIKDMFLTKATGYDEDNILGRNKIRDKALYC